MIKKKFSAYFQTQEIDFIMISNSNFERLRQVSSSFPKVELQIYEDVPGFESLRKFQIKINDPFKQHPYVNRKKINLRIYINFEKTKFGS